MPADLWACPECGRTFAARGQVHACAPLGDLAAHFARSEPVVREVFDALLARVSTFGPVSVLPQRSRIALHARMSFAAFVPRRRWLGGHLVLARRVESPRFTLVQVFSAGNVLHGLRLREVDEVDDELAGWLREAYAVGQQQHHRR